MPRRGRPPREPHGPRDLWHSSIHLRTENDALLCGGLVTRTNEDGWLAGAINGDMQDVRRDIEIVARANDIAMLELVAGPQLDLMAAQHVECGLVMRMDVGFGAMPGRDCGNPQPQRLRSDRLGADPWFVI